MSFIKDIFVAVIGFIAFGIFGICLICYYPFCVIKKFEENYVRKEFYKLSKFVMTVVKFISKSFVVEFKEKDTDGPCIVVANHSSILDIVTFCSVNFKDAVFLSKGWPTRIPLMNKYLKAAGNVIFDENTSFEELCSLVQKAFNKNLKVIVFPEGTRSEDGTVKRFHKGAFLIAQKLGVPVLPICIKGLDKTIKKNSVIVRSCDVKITVLNKIFIEKEEQVLDITRKTRQLIAEEKEKQIIKNIDIKKLMLHRPPMLLVDKVLEVVNGEFARTLFEIKSDNIFLDKNNVLKRSAQIEIMAQALAAANAYDSKINNKPTQKGFLVMLKNITFFADAKCGDVLECHINIVDFIAQTHIAKGKLFNQNGTLLCEGEIRIYCFD